jgi:hypothetical protein
VVVTIILPRVCVDWPRLRSLLERGAEVTDACAIGWTQACRQACDWSSQESGDSPDCTA